MSYNLLHIHATEIFQQKVIQMMLHIYAAQAVNFSSQKDYSSAYLISGILAAVIVIIGVIASIVDQDLFGIILGLIVAALAFFFCFIIVISMQSSFSESRINKFQAWASETYLIELTAEQAEDVLDNQINMEEKSDSDANNAKNKVVVKNGYGDAIEITLVQDGKDWFILQSGSEAPAAAVKG